jgi:hypothetical protein
MFFETKERKTSAEEERQMKENLAGVTWRQQSAGASGGEEGKRSQAERQKTSYEMASRQCG